MKKNISFTATLAIAFFAGIFIKLFIFDVLHILGESMVPGIHDGETVFVNKIAFGIQNPFTHKIAIQWKKPAENDVVIFHKDNKTVVKRCVLIEGDEIQLEIFDKNVYTLRIGGKGIPIDEEQFLRLSQTKFVPEGFIFVLGDNPDCSVDSRHFGFVSVKNITGRILGK